MRDCAKLCSTASASDPIWFDRADSEPESGSPGLPPERTWTVGEPRSYGSGSYRPETDGAEDEGGVALNGPRFTVLGTVRERASRAPRKMPEKLRLPFGGAMDDEVDAMAYLKRVNYPWGPGAAVKRKLRLITWMKAQVGGKTAVGLSAKLPLSSNGEGWASELSRGAAVGNMPLLGPLDLKGLPSFDPRVNPALELMAM